MDALEKLPAAWKNWHEKTIFPSKLSSVLTSLRHVDSANVIPQAGVVDFWNLFQLLSQEKALPLKLQLQAWFFLRRQVGWFQPSSKTDAL